MPVVGFLNMIGPTELMIILVIVLIVFGAGRLPSVFKSFGEGIKAFRDAQKDESIDVTPKKKELAHDELEEADEVQARSRSRSGTA
jgi:sec-independent protein translocase protein TatA